MPGQHTPIAVGINTMPFVYRRCTRWRFPVPRRALGVAGIPCFRVYRWVSQNPSVSTGTPVCLCLPCSGQAYHAPSCPLFASVRFAFACLVRAGLTVYHPAPHSLRPVSPTTLPCVRPFACAYFGLRPLQKKENWVKNMVCLGKGRRWG